MKNMAIIRCVLLFSLSMHAESDIWLQLYGRLLTGGTCVDEHDQKHVTPGLPRYAANLIFSYAYPIDDTLMSWFLPYVVIYSSAHYLHELQNIHDVVAYDNDSFFVQHDQGIDWCLMNDDHTFSYDAIPIPKQHDDHSLFVCPVVNTHDYLLTNGETVYWYDMHQVLQREAQLSTILDGNTRATSLASNSSGSIVAVGYEHGALVVIERNKEKSIQLFTYHQPIRVANIVDDTIVLLAGSCEILQLKKDAYGHWQTNHITENKYPIREFISCTSRQYVYVQTIDSDEYKHKIAIYDLDRQGSMVYQMDALSAAACLPFEAINMLVFPRKDRNNYGGLSCWLVDDTHKYMPFVTTALYGNKTIKKMVASPDKHRLFAIGDDGYTIAFELDELCTLLQLYQVAEKKMPLRRLLYNMYGQRDTIVGHGGKNKLFNYKQYVQHITDQEQIGGWPHALEPYMPTDAQKEYIEQLPHKKIKQLVKKLLAKYA